MHHGEDGVVQLFRILVEVLEDEAVLPHHLHGREPGIDVSNSFSRPPVAQDRKFCSQTTTLMDAFALGSSLEYQR